MLERGLGHRELDQHAVAREGGPRVGRDGDAELADAGRLAGIAAHGAMARRLQRRRHPQPRRLAVQRDDARAHAPGGAADYYIYRRGAFAGLRRRGGRANVRHR